MKILKIIDQVLNKFGYFNLKSSNKYRYVMELYDETRTLNKIQPLVNAVIDEFECEIERLDVQLTKSDNQNPKIFQYWHHGFENLPGVVKNSYQSVDYFLSEDFDIIRIEFNTLEYYINLPKHIITLIKEQKMTIAHFSDIVRNKLLLQYGGLWLDSTVLITGKDDINKFTSLDNRLLFSRFVFSNPKEHAVQFESWIMWSRNKGNVVYKIADEVLNRYWSKNQNVGNYFLYHIIITIIFLKDAKFRKLFNWYDRIYVGNSFDLGRYLIFREYNNHELQTVLQKTNIHKLDFKQDKIEKKLFGGVFFQDSFFSEILKSLK